MAPALGHQAVVPRDDHRLTRQQALVSGYLYRQEHYGARIFRPAGAAGLPDGTTPHDLRHHFATVMLRASGDPVAVAENMGHENATMVLRVYDHLMPGSKDRMRRAIDAAWTDTTGIASASHWQFTDKFALEGLGIP